MCVFVCMHVCVCVSVYLLTFFYLILIVMRERSASVDTVSSGMPSPQTDNPSTTAQATG